LFNDDEIKLVDLVDGRTSYLIGAMDRVVFSRDSPFLAARSYRGKIDLVSVDGQSKPSRERTDFLEPELLLPIIV
jgi:hypothetical protein